MEEETVGRKAWDKQPPEEVVARIQQQEQQLLMKARKESLSEYPEVGLKHMQAVIGNLFLGLPSDRIPRAASPGMRVPVSRIGTA